MIRLQQNLPADKEIFRVEVGGSVYTDKKEAGTAIINMCRQIKSFQDPVVVGTYLGFDMAISFDGFGQRFIMNLRGASSHKLELGPDPLGNIIRMNHALELMPKQLEEIRTSLDTTKRQMESAKQEVTKPFAQEQELKEKLDRLTALNALLNMDENGEQVEQKQESQDRSKAVHSSIREKLNSLKEKTAVSSGMERQLVRPLSVKKDECLQM